MPPPDWPSSCACSCCTCCCSSELPDPEPDEDEIESEDDDEPDAVDDDGTCEEFMEFDSSLLAEVLLIWYSDWLLLFLSSNGITFALMIQ